MHGFHLVRTHLEVVFHGQSIGKVITAIQVYKNKIIVSFDPVHAFHLVRTNLEVVFHGQSICYW